MAWFKDFITNYIFTEQNRWCNIRIALKKRIKYDIYLYVGTLVSIYSMHVKSPMNKHMSKLKILIN